MIPLTHILILSALLFSIGVLGVMLRRNVIVIFMSIELMLNAVNLSFIGFARSLDSMTGVIFIFFIIVVAAAEAVVGLSIILAIYRTRKSLNIDDFNTPVGKKTNSTLRRLGLRRGFPATLPTFRFARFRPPGPPRNFSRFFPILFGQGNFPNIWNHLRPSCSDFRLPGIVLTRCEMFWQALPSSGKPLASLVATCQGWNGLLVSGKMF